MPTPIVGDRFVALSSGRWRDLATGRLVTMAVSDDEERARRDCDAARAAGRLVDAGPWGMGRWFAASDHHAAVSDALARFAATDAEHLVQRLLPRVNGGTSVGRVRVAPAALDAFTGALSTALRGAGFVTLRAGVDMPDEVRRQLLHRHLCLVSVDRRDREQLAAWLRAQSCVSARAHLVVLVEPAREEAPTIAGAVPVSDGSPASLVREARPVFAGLPVEPPVGPQRAVAAPSSVASPGPVVPPRPVGAPRPSAPDADGRLERARRHARRGRHASAGRWYHAALESARRRRDDAGAVSACRELVGWLRRHERWDEALRRARQTLAKTVDVRARLELFVLLAELQLANAECRSAELTVAAAVAEAEVAGVPSPCALLVVRSELRFWQGRLDAAAGPPISPGAPAPGTASMVQGMAAWLRRDAAALEACANAFPAGATDLIALRRSTLAALLAALRQQPAIVRAHAGDVERLSSRLGCPRLTRLARLFVSDAAVVSGVDPPELRPPPPTAPRLDLLLHEWQAACRGGRRVDRERAAAALAAAGVGVVRAWRWGNRNMHLIHSIPRLLHLVQEADDEQGALVGACGWGRRETGAEAAAFLATDRTVVASDGWTSADTDALAAGPALSGSLSVRATASGDLVTIAVVRYAGVAVGFFALRGDPAREAAQREASETTAALCGPAMRTRLDLLSTLHRPSSLVAEILGRSPAIAALRESIARIAPTPFPVLIEGESGTGKELVARAIHRLSLRRERRFAAVNAAALTEDLVEAELFGHSRGAFTGAVAPRTGLFEDAHGGSLFLDEVSELSPRAQAKLLRVLQEREIRRVGENAARAVDVRLIAATNRPLAERVRAGAFREDLRFRLAVILLRLPPLRDRLEDVPILAHAIWRRLTADANKRAVLGPDAVARLCRYGWPGNVRELQNTMAALIVGAPDRGRVSARHVDGVLAGEEGSVLAPPRSLDEARAQGERTAVLGALARHGGRRALAARELGLSRQGLTKAMKRLGLDDRRREAGVA